MHWKLLMLGTILLSIPAVDAGILDWFGDLFSMEAQGGGSNTTGYEFLDSDTVIHFWNNEDDYYLNASSGIQISNHYNEYWTHNVFCLGYFAGDVWNKVQCNDELPNFNRIIDSDNLTYVNITYWRDINVQGYDVRTAVKYSLYEDYKELEVIPYIKNIDTEDISQDIGFAWRINNIKVNNTYENDKIRINNTEYALDQELNNVYSNMTKQIRVYNTSFNHSDNTTFPHYYETVFIPHYRVFDSVTKEVTDLRWDENLNYKVRVRNLTGQYNAPVDLFINAGGLTVGQEKQTKMFWIDLGTEPTFTWDDPTPDDASSQLHNAVYLNTTVTDDNQTGVFYDWNNDLELYWSIESYNTSGLFDNSTHERFGLFLGGLSTSNIEQASPYYSNVFFEVDNGYRASVQDPTAMQGMTEITVAAWVRVNEYNSAGEDYRMVIGKSNHASNREWRFRAEAGGMVWHVSSTGSSTTSVIATPTDLPENEWHHITGTWTNSTGVLNIYVDGDLIDTDTMAAAKLFSGTANVTMGTSSDNGGSLPTVDDFNGDVDEVRVWSRLLTNDEINASYNLSKSRLFRNFTNLENKTHNYSAWAADEDGNVVRSAVRTVTTGEAGEVTTYCGTSYEGSGLWNIATAVYCTNGTIPTGDINITSTGSLYMLGGNLSIDLTTNKILIADGGRLFIKDNSTI